MDNLLNKCQYRDTIFSRCKDEDFPKFFNITLTKIMDKYQNSLEEKSLKEFEKEIEKMFNYYMLNMKVKDLKKFWYQAKMKF